MKKNEFRVAMISEHGDPLAPLGGQQSGGQNVYVYELARSLSKLGIKVDVFTRWDNRKSAQIVKFAKLAKVIRIKAGPRQFISKDKFGNFMHEFTENFLKYMNKNKVEYRLIHAHYYYSGYVALKLKEKLNIPIIETFHSLGILKKKAMGKLDTSPNDRIKIEKEIVKKINRVVATSEQEKNNLIQEYKANPKKIIIIPAGVNLKIFYPVNQNTARKKINIPENKKIIVFAGKMERRKGALTLVESINILKQQSPQLFNNLVVYLFSGDPRKTRNKETKESAERHELKNLINKYKLENKIILMPGVEQKILHYYYSAADVVVMPSYYEPFGMVALEAMASGTPVIASNVGGLKSIIEEGITGLHVKPKNSNDLASKINEMLKNSNLINRLSKNSLKRVKEKYDWDIIAKEFLNVYQNLSKERK